MNILITNLNNTYNYGSMMMGENLITYLNKHFQNVNYYIDAKNIEHVNRLKEACSYDNIYLDKIFDITLITNKIKGIRRFERKFKDEIAYKKCHNFYDAIFILGGDDFSELYYKIPSESNLVINSLKHINNLNNCSKLYMIGQTIGPYTDERLELAKKVFNDIKIYSRDNTSAEYLEKNGIKVNISRDLAFLNLNLQNSQSETAILRKYSLKKDEYIIIVGTGLFENYETDKHTMKIAFEQIINNLKKKYPDKKIVWLSHVLNCNATDNRMLETLNKDLFDLIIDNAILPNEARFILGNGYFTVTCRMHAAVSTFQMKKPAICLSYSPKYNGVIARGLNMEDLVIEAKGQELWRKNIVDLIMNKVEYIERNYGQLQQKIEKEVSGCQKQVIDMLNDITKELK